MMRYGCHIPSLDRIGDASATFAAFLVERFRAREAGRNRASRTAMDDWENEGGSVAPAASNESNSSNTSSGFAPGEGRSSVAAMGWIGP